MAPPALPRKASVRGGADTSPMPHQHDSNSREKDLRRISLEPAVMNRRSSRAEKYDSPHLGPAKLKILLLGDSATGKTAVTQRFASNRFDPAHKPTVAVDFSQTSITVGTQMVRLALWNLAEKKEGTQQVNGNHFQGVHGAFIVVDITQPHTVAKMLQWKALIDETVAQVCM
eukprot:TRINITY_DN1619_c0_g1_i1.p1 TRINITY_DN1619_c0_g1~~TRINITY_DN1619_c0_g1_i1.p1  ORF type:complete len:172 (-),score=37.34 TRINITY_DN1619_c0_g1_i1:664-1179(-)